MACSTLNPRTTTASWKFKVLDGDSFKRFPETHYIRPPTSQGLKQRIISTLEKLPHYGQNVIAQFWAPTAAKITANKKNPIVLTTTYQPAVIYGNNKELHSYHEAFLQQKYYIDPEMLVAFGLPGRVFLTCKPEQTQHVHRYPKDQRPRGQYAFFTRRWGSFCVPVILDGQCVGVLEFVTDNLKDSYDNDIALVRTALEDAGFQNSTQIEPPKVTDITRQKSFRKTKSTRFTKYCCLVPYFGLTRGEAAVRLGQTLPKIKGGTFRSICRKVGISKWPWIPNTTRRASSFNGSQINQTASSDTSSLDASEDVSDISELIDYINTDSPEWSPEETTIVTASSPDSSENISNPSELIENTKAYFPVWSCEQTTIAPASPPETQNYHIAPDEDWIKRERERPDFMQEVNNGLIDIDPVEILFYLNKWENDQVQRFEPIP